jgi:hypothetical protein
MDEDHGRIIKILRGLEGMVKMDLLGFWAEG